MGQRPKHKVLFGGAIQDSKGKEYEERMKQRKKRKRKGWSESMMRQIKGVWECGSVGRGG